MPYSKEKQRAYDKEYRKKNIKRILENDRKRKPRKIKKAPTGYGRCSICKEYKLLEDMVKNKNRTNPNDGIIGYTNKCKPCDRIKSKILLKKSRLKILNHYGAFCRCCGESTYEFLTIDHINGGGNKHSKEIGKGTSLQRWIIKNNFPKEFQILCYNCNCAKGHHGICPHQLTQKPPK
jgi:hypothetical protein